MAKDEMDSGRRHALRTLAASATLLTGSSLVSSAWAQSTPQCVLTPEQTEGPYFVDRMLERRDIRTEPRDGRLRSGIPLQLNLQVLAVKAQSCQPLAGAVVDIWHCDAEGIYSGVNDPQRNTVGQQFLRGLQVADSAGQVQFLTIYPGWYPGRAVHIHFKIRSHANQGRAALLTSQLYFDDSITDQVYQNEPYKQRPNRYPRNERDGLFAYDDGQRLVLRPQKTAAAYVASYSIGVALS